MEIFGQITVIESSNGSSLLSHNSIILDGHGSNMLSDYGDDDSKGLVIIGEKVSKSNQGKTIEAIHQVVVYLMLFFISFGR